MKLLLPFFLITLFSVAFGQSPKKLNKQLRAQLVLERQKQDSAYAIFLKDKEYLEKLREEIYQKVRGPLAEVERAAGKAVFGFERKSEILKTLGVDPVSLVSDTILPKYPYARSRDVIKPLGDAWDNFPSFLLETRIGSDLHQFKVREQNERLFELIGSYQYNFKSNQEKYREQREYITRLEEFKPTIDRLITLYQGLAVRANTAHQILTERIIELKTNYQVKGPKGFPEAYRQAFPDLHPVTVKLGAPIENDIAMDANTAGDEIREVPKAESNHSPGIGLQERVIYQYVDTSASFPGGMQEMLKYLREHIVYPSSAKEEGISGKVYLRFVVSDTGRISDVEILRGIPDCPECDQEALRVVKAMPRWIPGKMGTKSVNMYFTLPIIFKLN
ncbi:MAG: energy transducer TonB [Fluviicola sp.]